MNAAHTGSAFLLALSVAVQVRATDIEAVASQARQLVDQEKFSEAITVLERSLPEANGNERFLGALRHAYRGETQRLIEQEDRQQADKYLTRLRLLEQKAESSQFSPLGKGAKATPPQDNVKVIVPDARDLPQATSNNSGWRAAVQSSAKNATVKDSPQSAEDSPSAKVLSVKSNREPPSTGRGDSAKAANWIKQADALFVARRFGVAGELYAKAHQIDPEAMQEATDRWTYCRIARVVEQINGQPGTEAEWAVIRSDVQSILELVPGNQFAQSLLAMTSPATKVAGVPGGNASTVVRASEPDSSGAKSANLLAGLATRIGLRCADNSAKRSLWQRFRSGPWLVLETSNFRVHSTNENLAGQAADIAESTRIELYRTWFGRQPETNWNPKCDIYIHDSADNYVRITRQGPGSPGHSQTGVERGCVVSRRIDLRRDGPDVIKAILPHEITHVVLADRFTAQAMPRWADEGMAVLTEPIEKKQAHLRNLGESSGRARLFTARQLMTMNDYPSGDQWSVFYAQSVSLVEFLVNRAGTAKFIEFLHRAQQNGYDSELLRVFGFASFDELDREWSRGRVEQIAAAMK